MPLVEVSVDWVVCGYHLFKLVWIGGSVNTVDWVVCACLLFK